MSSNRLEAIQALLAADLSAVDAVIRARLDSDVALIRQVSQYIIAAGGKRLRPAMLLMAAAASGYRGPQAHELAAEIGRAHV